MKRVEAAIRTEGLVKRYGKRRALAGLDLEVLPGEVFGYLGPNGAGKTTTIRVLVDVIRPSAGRASVFGLDSRRDSLAIRARVGYVPGDLALYGDLTGRQLLRYAANLRGAIDNRRFEDLADRLGAELDVRTAALSRGNRQKIGLIQAFMHDPELLLLDEPTTGLDPLVQNEVHQLVQEARARGRTVFLSSHTLPLVEQLCDRVAMIRGGRLISVDEVDALKDTLVHRVEIRFQGGAPGHEFSRLPGVSDVTADGHWLRCTATGNLDRVVKAAARHRIVDMRIEEPSLEDIFLTRYGAEGDHVAA